MAGLLRLEGACKRFHKGADHDTLVDLIAGSAMRILGRRRERRGVEEFWALRDVSFEVRPGEAVGLIGPNGAGKSTALKLIAGIMRPENGFIHKRGRLTALIEVGAGFHGDLTGRENIYMNATILGMRKPEIDRKYDAIVDFSGVEDFIDTPLKRYSSGMQARLGFSVAAHVEPDILLVDEVLSVGDVVFRQRCIERMRKLVSDGTILLFVTHHLEQMQSFCSRAVVLDHGRNIFDGETSGAVACYIDALKDKEGLLTGCDDRRVARVTGLTISKRGAPDALLTHANEPIQVEVSFDLAAPVRRLEIDIDIRRELGSLLASFSSVRDEVTFDAPCGAGRVVLDLPQLPLAGGQYFWRAILRDTDSATVIADTDYRYSMCIEDGGKPTGILCLPHGWRYQGSRLVEQPAQPALATVGETQ